MAAGLKASTGAMLLGLRVGGEDTINPPEDAAVTPGAELIYLAREPVLD